MDIISRNHGVEQLERTRDHNFTLWVYQSDRLTPAGLSADDVARFKVWNTAGAAPAIDIDSVDLPSGTFTADAGTDVLTGVTLTAGQRVKFSSSGVLPGGLSDEVVYYVIAGNKVSLTSGGAAVDITTAGTGTHSWTQILSRCVIEDLGITGTTPAKIKVELYRDEVDLCAAGTWNWEGSIVTPGDNNRIFVYSIGTFDVVGNATGDLGTT